MQKSVPITNGTDDSYNFVIIFEVLKKVTLSWCKFLKNVSNSICSYKEFIGEHFLRVEKVHNPQEGQKYFFQSYATKLFIVESTLADL